MAILDSAEHHWVRRGWRKWLQALALVPAVLLVAGCTASVGGDSTGSTSAASSRRYGVDYSWARPSMSYLKSNGYTFAGRYYSLVTGKNLTASEAKTLKNAGLDIVSVWENGAWNALNGYKQGQTDARAARTQANNVGEPSSRPIFFAIDFDATSSQQKAINAYFDGVASVIGRGRTGAYAGYYPINRLFNAGKVRWGWQTYAWSNGLWDSRAHLRQILNGIDNGQLDKDMSTATDFGQWGHRIANGVDSDPVTVSRDSGHLEAMVESGGKLFHRWWTSTKGWSGWASLGGSHFTGRPAVISRDAHHMDVFECTTGHAVEHRGWSSTSGWGKWGTLGGSIASNLAVVSRDSLHIDVFGRGTDGALHRKWWTSGHGWSSWASLGGSIGGSPAVVARDAYHMQVFARANTTLYHRWWSSGHGWSKWASLRGNITGNPVVVSRDPKHMEVFVRGKDGALHHKRWTSGHGWSWWASLGGSMNGDPAVVSRTSTRLEVFVREGKTLHHRWWNQNGGWSTWHSLGGSISWDPTAVSPDSKHMEVFARSPSASLNHIRWTAGSGWSKWGSLGGSNL